MDMQAAAIAANRFGLGARPGDLKAIAGDPRGWIKAQLTPERVPPAPIEKLPAAEDDLLAFGRWLVARQLRGPDADKVAARAAGMGYSTEELKQLSIEQSFILNFRQRYEKAVRARIEAVVTMDRSVYERLVHFWSNHFTVSGVKPQAVALPPSFEHEAIRPHVVGRFEEMLLASTRHPGMLVYLDNAISIGPNSLAAKRPRLAPRAGGGAGPAKGINENLAREILELHTLGVKGGYTQKDVQALAAIITGWNFDRPRPLAFLNQSEGTRTGPQLFKFDVNQHEPGAQTLLGKTYAQAGEARRVAALTDLARHKSTSRFIATKLARHYIADDPPAAAVDRIAAAFANSSGDLRQTMFAVVDSPEAWSAPLAKFKRPEEFLISFARMARLTTLPQQAAMVGLQTMGQPPYRAQGPDGWSDSASSWLSADLVWKRLEWTEQACARIARADIDPAAIGQAVLGPALGADTLEAIRRAESPAQGLALLAGSPEFQRR